MSRRAPPLAITVTAIRSTDGQPDPSVGAGAVAQVHPRTGLLALLPRDDAAAIWDKTCAKGGQTPALVLTGGYELRAR